MGEKFPSRG